MRFNRLEDWLEWQQTLHPRSIDLGLERVAEVWQRLAPAQAFPPLITIAGTNGKGSCGAMLEAIYRAAGYRTGCYSSPHVLRYNERIRIDGEPVTDRHLMEANDCVDRARGEVALTYFEFGTLAALDLFARAGLDLVVLEVGLGGRLDAVNILDADVAVVTTIAMDHMAWLGDTPEAIAREKAGIFRSARPAVIGQRDTPTALTARAEEIEAPLLQLGRDFDWSGSGGGWAWEGLGVRRGALPLPSLRGRFQLDNAATALAAAHCLRERLPLGVDALRRGLQRAQLAGRFQVLPGDPAWILDVAHNPAAAESLAQNLMAFACRGSVWAVYGSLADKQSEAVVGALAPLVKHWILTAPAHDPRALSAGELAEQLARVLQEDARILENVDAALRLAQQQASPGDAILVFGSFGLVEAALRYRGTAAEV